MTSALTGANVLITGGAGFVGSYIADLALDQGASQVTVIDNFVRGSLDNLRLAQTSERLTIVQGDIADRELVDQVTRGVDFVFHQAALRITHCAAEPQRAVNVMMNGTQNVLDAAVQHKVQRVLAASSASVYGEPSYLPMDERHPFNNRTLYGALKIANEQMLRCYREMYGLRYVAIRPFNVYGPRMDAHGAYTEVMIRWLERLGKGEPPIIFGDGFQTMDFVYVRDLAEAYLQAALADVDDEVFNIGSGTETSLLQLCQILCESSNHPDLQPEFQPPRAVNPVSRRLADLTRARDALGFEPTTSLAEGLTNLVEWYGSLEARPLGNAK
ncbi:MAG TPA: NAD-dependent epimerase/dehydratase family protein [Dehalococcoidia bacterium]|nr:NAD-dependent epimerase/dehydratase family protein [Dehalococcoidia bacterium]